MESVIGCVTDCAEKFRPSENDEDVDQEDGGEVHRPESEKETQQDEAESQQHGAAATEISNVARCTTQQETNPSDAGRSSRGQEDPLETEQVPQEPSFNTTSTTTTNDDDDDDEYDDDSGSSSELFSSRSSGGGDFFDRGGPRSPETGSGRDAGSNALLHRTGGNGTNSEDAGPPASRPTHGKLLTPPRSAGAVSRADGDEREAQPALPVQQPPPSLSSSSSSLSMSSMQLVLPSPPCPPSPPPPHQQQPSASAASFPLVLSAAARRAAEAAQRAAAARKLAQEAAVVAREAENMADRAGKAEAAAAAAVRMARKIERRRGSGSSVGNSSSRYRSAGDWGDHKARTSGQRIGESGSAVSAGGVARSAMRRAVVNRFFSDEGGHERWSADGKDASWATAEARAVDSPAANLAAAAAVRADAPMKIRTPTAADVAESIASLLSSVGSSSSALSATRVHDSLHIVVDQHHLALAPAPAPPPSHHSAASSRTSALGSLPPERSPKDSISAAAAASAATAALEFRASLSSSSGSGASSGLLSSAGIDDSSEQVRVLQAGAAEVTQPSVQKAAKPTPTPTPIPATSAAQKQRSPSQQPPSLRASAAPPPAARTIVKQLSASSFTAATSSVAGVEDDGCELDLLSDLSCTDSALSSIMTESQGAEQSLSGATPRSAATSRDVSLVENTACGDFSATGPRANVLSTPLSIGRGGGDGSPLVGGTSPGGKAWAATRHHTAETLGGIRVVGGRKAEEAAAAAARGVAWQEGVLERAASVDTGVGDTTRGTSSTLAAGEAAAADTVPRLGRSTPPRSDASIPSETPASPNVYPTALRPSSLQMPAVRGRDQGAGFDAGVVEALASGTRRLSQRSRSSISSSKSQQLSLPQLGSWAEGECGERLEDTNVGDQDSVADGSVATALSKRSRTSTERGDGIRMKRISAHLRHLRLSSDGCTLVVRRLEHGSKEHRFALADLTEVSEDVSAQTVTLVSAKMIIRISFKGQPAALRRFSAMLLLPPTPPPPPLPQPTATADETLEGLDDPGGPVDMDGDMDDVEFGGRRGATAVGERGCGPAAKLMCVDAAGGPINNGTVNIDGSDEDDEGPIGHPERLVQTPLSAASSSCFPAPPQASLAGAGRGAVQALTTKPLLDAGRNHSDSGQQQQQGDEIPAEDRDTPGPRDGSTETVDDDMETREPRGLPSPPPPDPGAE